ncbi:PREDICTED: ankyrin repeat-containing protein At2g01680-like [Fragaria vesca subsp. vesca]|uniref:ankyrin repeat-containing protein At2g01680-like n=1 Tax=Fragaria vesca subsp. vesca TaxID=101020 RepID=UPI0002C2E356|nr:PREDICTED: ankyrin repeat-containing protein At2g01680-like [Fragaria vesca subsp. vesca]
MDERLIEASRSGNVQLLHQLLVANPVILHSVALASGENPLHIASLAGHVEFVKEVLRLKPAFAKEINQDCFTPMHIASANGYVDIAKELLLVDPRLSQLKGKDQWTALHFAASRGRIDIIKEMVSACSECVEDVTEQGETVFHLAVKNNRFEAMEAMVGLVRQRNKLDILNMKDNNGNSVLHLATWKKQHQVVRCLLAINGTSTPATLDVNSVNQSGLTALDLLLIFPSGAGDLEIDSILRGSGALRARDIVHTNHNHTVLSIPDESQHSLQTDPKNLVEYFKFRRGRDSPDDARNALLVVAVLVATATYETALNPPGGLWPDTNLSKNGTEPLQGYNLAYFFIGAVYNSIGFSVSLYIINILTTNFPLRLELQVCIGGMYATYINALVAISPDLIQSYVLFVLVFVLVPLLPMVVLLAVRLIIRLTQPLRNRLWTFGFLS